jgi:hypothetical protein
MQLLYCYVAFTIFLFNLAYFFLLLIWLQLFRDPLNRQNQNLIERTSELKLGSYFLKVIASSVR